MKTDQTFPSWLVYGVPIVLWIYVYVEHVYGFLSKNGYREYGLIENLTAIILFVSIVYFIFCLKKMHSFCGKAWILTLILGATYFLGEEISWGHHIFNYTISDQWASINDQKEPTLHNLKGVWEIFFDNIPRQLLSAGVLIGGLLGWWKNRKADWPPEKTLRQLIPEGNTLFITVIAYLTYAPEKILEHVLSKMPNWLVIGNDAGELQECLLAFFIMLYAYNIREELSVRKRPSSQNP